MQFGLIFLYWGYVFFGKQTTKVKYHVHPIISRLLIISWLISVDLNLDALAEWVFVRFLHYSTLSLSILYFLDRNHYTHSMFKKWEKSYVPFSWRWRMCISYLEVFYMGYLSVLPHLLIYLDIHVCYYKLTGIYFICWVIIQCSCICYLPQIIPALITGSSLNGLLGPFNGNSSFSVCVILLNMSLLSGSINVLG